MEKEKLKYSNFNVKVEIEGKRFIYNTITDNFIITNNTSIDLIKDSDEDTINQLIDGGFCVDKEIDELKLLLYSYQSARFNSSILNIFLIPSMACNLDCEYCFTKNKKSLYMDESTANCVVSFIYSLSKSTKQINITWGGGGEPLMKTEIILFIEQKLRQRVTVPIFSTVITNGTLLDEITVNKLLNVGVNRLVVTLDGPAEIHNRRRHLISGEGSFKLIMQNLKNATNMIECVVRIVVDKENDTYIDSLIDSLKEFSGLKVTLLHKMNCVGNCSGNMYNKDTFKMMLESSNKYKNCYWGGIKPYLSLCNALRNFDFTINVDGGIYKCPVELDDISCCIGNVRYGIKVNKCYLEWMTHMPGYNNEKCLWCKYFPICSGLCLKVREKYWNEFECNELKEIYNAIIKNKIQKWI